MPFSSTEKQAIAQKLSLGLLSTANDAPGAKYWYNENFAWSPITPPSKLWNDFDSILGAPSSASADANVLLTPTIIEKRKVRLTHDATSNFRAYLTRSTYSDNTSAILENWIQPSLIRYNGDASNGYSIRLYHGDPDAGGVEITTVFNAVSGDPCWVYGYSNGILQISTDQRLTFQALYNTNGLWVVGYRYIGSVGGSGTGSVTNALIDKGTISSSSDFPLASEVRIGWFYKVQATTYDIDPIRTNTGQTFYAGSKIEWNGINWTAIDNETSTSYNSTFIQSITDADLVSGKIVITHNLTSEYVYVLVADNTNKQIIPDDILFIDGNTFELDLSGYQPLQGTWTISVISGVISFNQTATTYTQNFTESDLVNGQITFTHNLNQKYVYVLLIDENDEQILPAEVRYIDKDNTFVDLYGFSPISGTWRVVISLGGVTTIIPSPESKEVQIDTIIFNNTTKLIDSIPVANIKTVKYTVYMETYAKYCSKEVMVINKNGSIYHSIYNILGDKVLATFDIEAIGSDMEFNIINSEPVQINSKIIRHITYV